MSEVSINLSKVSKVNLVLGVGGSVCWGFGIGVGSPVDIYYGIIFVLDDG